MSENNQGTPIDFEAVQAVLGSGVLDMLNSPATRRGFGTAGLGAMLGALGGMMLGAQPAEAKPSDVKGSPNIPLRVYANTSGKYILWADGSITNTKNASDSVTPGSTPYPVAPGYQNRSLVSGKTKGSPNVAVDVIQDEDGTYVLFADGTVRKPPTAGASAPPFGTMEYFWAKTAFGSIPRHSSNLTVAGSNITFKHPFQDPPFVVHFYKQGDWYIMFLPMEPSANLTRTGFTVAPWNTAANEGGFFGFGSH